jgi:hypothetical protein
MNEVKMRIYCTSNGISLNPIRNNRGSSEVISAPCLPNMTIVKGIVKRYSWRQE